MGKLCPGGQLHVNHSSFVNIMYVVLQANNDHNVIMSQNIEGFRGDKDIEFLIKFIESNTEGKGKTKNNSAHSNGPVGFGNKQPRNNIRREDVVTGTKARRERAVEDGHDEEKASGRNRVGSKQSSKDHRGSDKIGSGGQLKKSNSLEEISKTKLEDLTAEQSGTDSTCNSLSFSTQISLRRPKKQATLDDEMYSEKDHVVNHRLWGTGEMQHYYYNDGSATLSSDECSTVATSGRKRRGIGDEKKKTEDGVPAVVVSTTASEETEFHVVTKKQRRKKRRSSSGSRAGSSSGVHGGLFGDENRRPAVSQYGHSYYQSRADCSSYYQRKGFPPGSGFPPHDRTVEREGGGVMLYQYRHHHRPRSPEHIRRKSTSSMPPSDKSDSSDLDSVHSLPVSSTTPKLTLDQMSTSSGSTPQASYADITRMASSNVSSSSSTQGSCNMNAGKWPIVSATKSQAITSPAITTSTSTTTTTTISSTPISSTNATPTSTVITSSTTSFPAVATPLALNNPQFITGPKLNIGVPPVCGSKATTSTPANPTNSTCINSNNTIPQSTSPASVTTGDTSSLTLNQNPETSYDPALSSRHRNTPSPDPRSKRDATTSTTLDYKLIPLEEHNSGHKLQTPVNKPAEHQLSSPNVIMDSYYPSLEESFVADKVDRKPGRCNNSCQNSTSSRLPAEENPPSAVPPSNVSASNLENCGKGSRHQDICGEIGLKQQHVETAVIVPMSSSCCAREPVAPEVSVASAATVMASNNQSKDVMLRSKSCRKVSGAGSIVVATSSVRPPVIIMDEQEQEAAFRENVGTVSGLTFGFEVNEQLLMSDGDDNSRSPSAEPPSTVEEAVVNTSPTSGCIASDMPLPDTMTAAPNMTSNAGEDFSARYREPVSQQADNHDLIVTFVGLGK